jgi:DNA end-binding protein Ku
MTAKKAAPRRGRKTPGRRARSDETGERGAPASHALWSGNLGFGLVQIPVRLLSAEGHEDLSFHQLDRRDLSRIRYERISEATGRKVAWKDIVKGFEMPDGRYVVVDDEDFEKANVKATHTIDIQSFVDASRIPPMYFERPYVLAPEKGSSKAYAILRGAMLNKGLVAVALVVIRARQHLCAILPVGDLLVLEILRFEEDLKPLANQRRVSIPSAASKKEIALAERLIDSLREEWDPSRFQDTYRHDLMRAIASKAKTGKVPKARAAAPRPNVMNLVALLEKSVSRSKSKSKAKRAA